RKRCGGRRLARPCCGRSKRATTGGSGGCSARRPRGGGSRRGGPRAGRARQPMAGSWGGGIVFSENDPRGGPPPGCPERFSFLTVIIAGACPLDLHARGHIWGPVDAWQRPNLPNGVSPLAQSSAWVRSENQTSSTLFAAAAQVGNWHTV